MCMVSLQPGLPTMLNANGRQGISPDRIVNLAIQKGSCKLQAADITSSRFSRCIDTDADFDLHLFKSRSPDPNNTSSRFAFSEFFDGWKRNFHGECFAESDNPIPTCDQFSVQEQVKCFLLEQIFNHGLDPWASGLIHTVDNAFKAFGEVPDEFVGHLNVSRSAPDLAPTPQGIMRAITDPRSKTNSGASLGNGKGSNERTGRNELSRRHEGLAATPIGGHDKDHKPSSDRAIDEPSGKERRHEEDRRGREERRNCQSHGEKASTGAKATREKHTERKPRGDIRRGADVIPTEEGKLNTVPNTKDDSRKSLTTGRKGVSSVPKRARE